MIPSSPPRNGLLILCGIVLLHAHSILGATVVLGAVDDTTLYQDATGSLANGSGRGMFAGRTASGQLRRGLLRFDLAGSIPAGAIITSVTLSMHVTRENTLSPATSITLHEVLQSWTEGTTNAGHDRDGGGAFPEAGDTTWLHTSFSTALWAVAGGSFDPAASSSTLVDGTATYLWTGAAMITDVQNWLDNPAMNAGWLFKDAETTNRTARRFATHEELDAALRPSLTVTFDVVPEPGRAVLLGIGIASVVVRRRRVSRIPCPPLRCASRGSPPR